MTLYVLDTDIVGFAFQRHSTVLQRLQRLPENDLVVTTIITFGEDLGGWLPACRRAPDGVARARAYARLQRGLDFYQQWVCLSFDEAAAAIFDQRRARRNSASVPMISPLPRSPSQSTVLWSHAIRLIFSASPVSCWRTGRNPKHCPHRSSLLSLRQRGFGLG